MTEISEKTKLSLQLGLAVTLALALLAGGRYWGSIESERAHTASTLERHEADIRELRQTFAQMQSTLQSIQNSQDNSKESLATAVRNTTYLVGEIGNVKVALAERGIVVRGGG